MFSKFPPQFSKDEKYSGVLIRKRKGSGRPILNLYDARGHCGQYSLVIKADI